MKIYTKTGDKGSTSLYGGKRILKSHARIASYGNTDELNSHVGMLIAMLAEDNIRLVEIQHELFVIGSHLAAGNDHDFKLPTIETSFITRLEEEIDRMNESLPKLKHFVLPGGSTTVSQAHICRTVTRRTERSVVLLAQSETVDPNIIQYLNRLSDYLFVLARYIAFKEGIEEIKWEG